MLHFLADVSFHVAFVFDLLCAIGVARFVTTMR